MFGKIRISQVLRYFFFLLIQGLKSQVNTSYSDQNTRNHLSDHREREYEVRGEYPAQDQQGRINKNNGRRVARNQEERNVGTER